MKLDHLTFGQLYRLASPETKIRVTRAFHVELARAWELKYGSPPADAARAISQQEARFPEIGRRYRKIIKFLSSHELKIALYRAAAAQPSRPIPGMWTEFRRLVFARFGERRACIALARLIVIHCQRCGIPAYSRQSLATLTIFVETDSMGSALLTYKPGLLLDDILGLTLRAGLSLWQVMPWVPIEAVRFHKWVNPSVWPVDAPDAQETAKELLELHNVHNVIAS